MGGTLKSLVYGTKVHGNNVLSDEVMKSLGKKCADEGIVVEGTFRSSFPRFEGGEHLVDVFYSFFAPEELRGLKYIEESKHYEGFPSEEEILEDAKNNLGFYFRGMNVEFEGSRYHISPTD